MHCAQRICSPRVRSGTIVCRGQPGSTAGHVHSWRNYKSNCKHKCPTFKVAARVLLDDRRPQGESEFSWTKQWYCVGITEDFDQVRPNSVTLLNTDLVIWFSSSDNSWHCFQDRCPHRAASLSEGKVWEDGTLHCSYHGWRFRGNGTCTVIPQAASDEAETKACSKPGACAKTYSIKDLQGKLFVWAEPGAAAAAEAARTPLPIDELQAEAESKGTKLLQAMPTYARILPYDYQTLIENLIDPAHVPIAHHGVAGNRNNVKHGNEESRREETKPGTVFSVSRRAATSLVFDRNAPLYLEMHPPSMVLYYQRKPDGTFFSFPAWCTPISPGKSLLVTHQTTDYDTVPLFLRIITKLPRWADHVFLRLKVVDGDNALLVHQERLQIKEDKSAPEGSPPAWRRLFFMPTSSDVSIVAFRTWLDGTAKGGPFGPLHRIIDYPPKPVRMQILDRLSSHTEKCSSCRTVYRRVERLLDVAQSLSRVLWGAACALLLCKSPVLHVVAAASCAFFLSSAAKVLRWLRDNFVFVDYRHADIE